MNTTVLKSATSNEAHKKNLTETEAAAEYGMSVHWYRRSRWAGDGPCFIKLGGAILYPRTELESFFDARLVKSTSESSIRKLSATGRA
ncbi:MAG: helix-turn-helix domain-containing protein [Proteobacteria bacterium]|nr:helix-turn-helix domain-containing protein [Pseudomonadota bacterium]